MAAPSYFLPNVYRQQLIQGGRFSAALLEARGLIDIFGDMTDLTGQVSLMEITGNGPGGLSGTMLTPLTPGGEPPKRLGYHPSQQAWHDEGEFWVGFDNALPPTPTELQRVRTVGGYFCKLAGQDWLVPILRRPNDTTELPTSYRRERDGRIAERVRAEYRELWEATGEIIQWFTAGTLDEVYRKELGRLVDWCVRLLAVNYRFDWTLQNHLGVIGSHDVLLMLSLAIDWPAVQAVDPQKKTGLDLTTGNSPAPSDAPTNTLPGSAAAAVEDTPQVAG